MESLTQKIVRILISNIVSIAFFFILLARVGSVLKPELLRFMPLTALAFIAVVVFEDYKILTGRA